MCAKSNTHAIPLPTTRYLCPIHGCEWTHDKQGPPDAPTEAVLHRHLELHGLEEMLREIMHLKGALATIVNYYDMLPGEGQEDTPTDWQYVARVMRTIANEVDAPEEMHGT